MLQRGHSGDGCVLASALCKDDMRKDDLYVLSWARVRRVRRGSISSELDNRHPLVSSNRFLPSFNTLFSSIIEHTKVIQCTEMCQECTLHHKHSVLLLLLPWVLVRLSLGSRFEIAEFPDGVHWFAP